MKGSQISVNGCIAMIDKEGSTLSWGKGQTKHIELVIHQSKKTLTAATADRDTDNKKLKKNRKKGKPIRPLLPNSSASWQSLWAEYSFQLNMEREIR